MIEKVRTGQSVELKASTWNSFINAANYVNSIQQNSTGKPHQSGLDNLVLVKNTTGRTYPQFAAIGLSDLVIKATDEMEFKSHPPVFIGTQVTTGNENMPFAILLEPLQSNQVGKAMVLGVTQAQVYINASEDQFAIPKPDSYTGELHSSTSGIAKILWKAGSSGLQWCVLQLGGAGGGTYVPPSYNGYFTIKDVSTYNEDGTVKEYRVAVCDGTTWNAETQTSGVSLLRIPAMYDSGYYSTLEFPSTIFTITEYTALYIKYGPTRDYFNKIVKHTEDKVVGYIYMNIGSVSIYEGKLLISQELTNINVIPPQLQRHYGNLAIVGLETPDGLPISGKYAVCDGMSWNPATQTSSNASRFYVNGMEMSLPSTIIEASPNDRIYINREKDNAFEIIVGENNLPDDTEEVYGYVCIGYPNNTPPIINNTYSFNVYRRRCAII